MLQAWTMPRPRIEGIAERGGAPSEIAADSALGVLDDAGYKGTLATHTRRVLNAFVYSLDSRIPAETDSRFWAIHKWWDARNVALPPSVWKTTPSEVGPTIYLRSPAPFEVFLVHFLRPSEPLCSKISRSLADFSCHSRSLLTMLDVS